MKTLLVFPQKDGQTGLFILRSLEKSGCIVRVVDPKEEPEKMLEIAREFEPEFLLCSRTEILAKPMVQLKKDLPKTILACWNVDKRTHAKEFNPPLLKLFGKMDLMYTIALGNVSQYEEFLPPSVAVKHLQQGCDPLTHKTEKLTRADHRHYGCDVLFAGSMRSCGKKMVENQRKPLLNSIGKKYNVVHVGIKGPGHGDAIADSTANRAYRAAKINLGHNGWPNVAISMSVRDYKIMGAGGFLLTQYCKGMENWFELGKECVVYKSTRECMKLIGHYLGNPKKRAEIARAGQKVVYAKHTYQIRIDKMLNDVHKLRMSRAKI